MITHRVFLPLALVSAFLVAPGCSSDKWVSGRPKVVPVSGRVLFNEKPLAGAHVTFLNAAAGRSAFGQTDEEGKFRLTTFETNDGAVPGEQQVSVSKVVLTKGLDPSVDRTTISAPTSPDPDRRWLIPQHYGDFTTSGLKAEVTEAGPNDIVLVLKGAGEK